MTQQDTIARDWVLRFADLVIAEEPALTEFDQAAGDGDFGANIAGACCRVREEVAGLPADATAQRVLGAAAEVFLDEVGGTSGPLFGLLFQAISGALAGTELTPAALAGGVADGLAAIQRVGEAQSATRRSSTRSTRPPARCAHWTAGLRSVRFSPRRPPRPARAPRPPRPPAPAAAAPATSVTTRAASPTPVRSRSIPVRRGKPGGLRDSGPCDHPSGRTGRGFGLITTTSSRDVAGGSVSR